MQIVGAKTAKEHLAKYVMPRRRSVSEKLTWKSIDVATLKTTGNTELV
jgi:hypothetical protein